MPSDDLVLSVRQIAGYPDGGILPSDTLLMQRGGLGGPYVSVEAQTLVAGALQAGGPLQVGVDVPVNAGTGGILCDWLVGDALYFNAYTDETTDFILTTGLAGKIGLYGEVLTFNLGYGVAGSAITWIPACTINVLGEMALPGSVTLGRDPIAPLEAATAQWVLANSVSSFNMRRGAIMLNLDDIICAGGAPIFSPMFQGCPQAPTVPPWTNSSQLATTAFVQMAIAEFLGGGGAYAPLDSPAFSGVPTAPTAPLGSADGQLATTAFVMTAVADSTAGVASFNGRTGLVVLSAADINGVGGALLSSPIFTGTPQAPTATVGTSTLQLATTAFVMNALAGTTGVASFNTRTGVVTLTSADVAAVGVSTFNGRIGAVNLIANDISAAGGAILASPAFSGVPSAPTATAGTNTVQLATTAFVMAAVAAGGGVLSFNGRAGAVTLTAGDVTAVLPASTSSPLMNGTASVGSANAWARGDHVHPTDTSLATVAQLANYLPLTGGTLTGLLTVNANLVGNNNITTGANMVVNTAAGTAHSYVGQSAGLIRWIMRMGNGIAESGSNVGADLDFVAYADNGSTVLSAPLTMKRSTGVCTFSAAIVNGPSDRTLKENIEPINGALDDVLALQGVRFNMIATPDKPEIGLIAQDVEPIVPEVMQDFAVFDPASGARSIKKALDYPKLTALLIEAVKTLAARVAALEGT